MASIEISEHDQRIICEAAEDVLRNNEGRTHFRLLWDHMETTRPEVAKIRKRHGKKSTFRLKVLPIMLEWQQTFASKIGYAKIKRGNWFWFGDNTAMPGLSLIEVNNVKGEEAKFYAPFAEWLEKRKECAKAISTGDKVRGKKWSNPDVVGVITSQKLGGVVNYELVSAEIKTSAIKGEIITGFGQACAYKLFSHKSFLVVPADSNEDELQRVRELCEQYDIGLVVFDKTNPEKPAFDLRHSAKPRGNPNPSHVNGSIKKLLKDEGYDIF